eukprot:2515742-Prymnesium_polylepis.1
MHAHHALTGCVMYQLRREALWGSPSGWRLLTNAMHSGTKIAMYSATIAPRVTGHRRRPPPLSLPPSEVPPPPPPPLRVSASYARCMSG